MVESEGLPHLYGPLRCTGRTRQELLLKYEPDNSEDSHAVAVLNEDVIVGHVLYNLAPVVEERSLC